MATMATSQNWQEKTLDTTTNKNGKGVWTQGRV
jgi:hypothetical protein